MNNQPIRIGVIGAGANTTAKHIPLLQQIPGVEIVGVCNRTRESSQRVADRFGIPRVYDQWEDAIADPDTDAIVIGTWPYLHCAITLAALGAGKHVLTEARMAMNASEAHAMHSAAQARPHLIAQVVPSPITLAVDATLQRMLTEGWLGELLLIDVRMRSAFLDREAPLHWRQDVELSGMNIMMLGIYYEAIMRWAGTASRVTAHGKVFAKTRKDAAGVERTVKVPEHLEVSADMECGAQLHLQQSAVTPFLQGEGISLFGDQGVLRFHDGKLIGGRKGDSEPTEIEIPDHERSEWRVEEEFINAIRGKEEVKLTTFADGVKYMEFTEAVHRSLSTGHSVSLPLKFEDELTNFE